MEYLTDSYIKKYKLDNKDKWKNKDVERIVANNLREDLKDAEIFYPGDIVETAPYDYLLSFRGK